MKNPVNCWELQNGQSAAKPEREGSTTISKESRIKRSEVQGILRDDDIVFSAWEQVAVTNE
jgi:hypothetical protein